MRVTESDVVKNKAPRITIRYLWQEVLSTLSWDKGLFFTIKALLLNPGHSIRNYLAGDRSPFSHPVRFLVFITAIATFAVIRLDLFGKLYEDTGAWATEEAARQHQQAIVTIVYQYYNIITFLSVPILALISYLFYRRTGYNYAEHLVLNTFLVAEGMVLYLLVTIGMYYYPIAFNTVYQSIWLAYFTWSLYSFFHYKTGKGFFKAFLVCLLYLLLLMLIGGVVGLLSARYPSAL